MNKTTYTIVQAPVSVEYTCPHCGYENEDEWEDFLSLFADGYEAWTGRTNDIFDCEECGENFNFNGVDID